MKEEYLGMTKEEFYEWLKTCPAKEELGYRVIDDYGEVKVHFWFDDTEEEV